MNFSSEIIAEELRIFETRFKDSVKSNVPLIDRIMRYIVKTKGKQLRPMFVLLSAKLSGSINESTYRAASLVELLHTASLVHDDVVDEATTCWPRACCYAWTMTISGSCRSCPGRLRR
jgi:octaprenyl-diphosphate synthase